MSYLPLSHSAGQIGDIFGPLYARCCVYFADESALQGTLVETLTEVRPTFFLGVPRVFEKIQEKLQTFAAQKSSVLQSISGWAKGKGYKASMAMAQSKWPPLLFWLAHFAVLRNIKKAVGVDQVKVFSVGAAPIQRSTLDYFLSLNWVIVNMYGMSETGGPTTGSSFFHSNLYSAGYALPGTDLIIFGPNREVMPAGERGEICFRGRNKFMGYYKNEEATKETIDVDGWIHSGDEGYLESDGALKITGRFKELIITAGGENIPPVIIETEIKDRCPLLSQVFLIGDNRNFLSALVTIKNEMEAGQSPSDKLTPDAKRLLASIGSDATDVPSAVACKKVYEYINSCIDKYNQDAVSRAQSVRKFTILRTDFSITGGEMTPTMKMRRRIVHDKYEKEIEAMYEEAKL